MTADLIVKDNTLVNSSYSLSLTEQRIILMCVAVAQKKGKVIDALDPVDIRISEFVSMFEINEKSAYREVRNACDTILSRQFSYKFINKNGKLVLRKSNWLQHADYLEDEGVVRMLFTPSIIPFISDLNRAFTKYYLQDVVKMTSVYGIRLYELIIAWQSICKTPVFELEEFRENLGVKEDEYRRMTDFKRRVLDVAVNQINEFSNLKVKYEQHKRGRKITGFSFIFYEKECEVFRDPNTVDWVGGLSDSEKAQRRKKRKTITKSEAERMARVGESWSELLARLAPNFYIKDL